MTTTATIATDPLNLPEKIARLTWYRKLLEERAEYERSRQEMDDRRIALQQETESRLRAAVPPTQDEREEFRALISGIRNHDRQLKENLDRLGVALLEHHDEVDAILTEQIESALGEARAVAADVAMRLADAVDSCNRGRNGKELLRSTLLKMNRDVTHRDLTASIPVPPDAPARVASPIQLLERVTAG